ncbi:hypothetical protein [Nocardioides campestrisoli]|uniref:hypothetical protein n=1 Tax=Nocardioides campestrisoli TaxID=2736757 RepID=UPI00163D52FC|nr:hypothetical protein [Nocardioides campestrisoli]
MSAAERRIQAAGVRPRRHTRASRLAAVGTGLIALVIAVRATQAPSTVALILQLSALIVAVLGATLLWWHNSFESRVLVGFALVVIAGGTLLAATAGMPGSRGRGLLPAHLLILGLCAGVALALVADGRARLRRAPLG